MPPKFKKSFSMSLKLKKSLSVPPKLKILLSVRTFIVSIVIGEDVYCQVLLSVWH